jgi:hypothetical protein
MTPIPQVIIGIILDYVPVNVLVDADVKNTFPNYMREVTLKEDAKDVYAHHARKRKLVAKVKHSSTQIRSTLNNNLLLNFLTANVGPFVLNQIFWMILGRKFPRLQEKVALPTVTFLVIYSGFVPVCRFAFDSVASWCNKQSLKTSRQENVALTQIAQIPRKNHRRIKEKC